MKGAVEDAHSALGRGAGLSVQPAQQKPHMGQALACEAVVR